MKPLRHDSSGRRRGQAGLSLVELMVGITVGLFVLGGATLLVATQLGDNRQLLLETQLRQDLRATMDIMTRELRRSGVSDLAVNNVWFPGSAGAAPSALAPIALSADGSEVTFRYRRGSAEGPYGFKLEGSRIKSLLGGNWQDLTDATVMEVTDFAVVLDEEIEETIPCPRACSVDPTDTACWPSLIVRNYTVTLAVQAVSDENVRRSQSSRVRVRNDRLSFNDPLNPTRLCPT